MRDTVLLSHNAMRWAILAAALWAIVQGWHGYLFGRTWRRSDFFAELTLTTLLNLQVMLGLMVYLRSTLVRPMFSSFGYATSALPIAFFTLLHPLAMISSVAGAQAIYSIAKRASSDQSKMRWTAWGYTCVTGVILTAIPWPFLPYGRPLIPQSMQSLQKIHLPENDELDPTYR
jgi:hypothetical protein